MAYAFALLPISLETCNQESSDLHRDGVPFARFALREVEARIDGQESYENVELRRWVYDDSTTETASQFWRRMREHLRQLERERDRLLAGGGNRPKRSMPSLVKIAAWHGLSETPACFRCGVEWGFETWRTIGGRLERAHIIDRVFGGLDLPSNLLPLCCTCHRRQPIFRNGDEAQAIEWFTSIRQDQFQGAS